MLTALALPQLIDQKSSIKSKLTPYPRTGTGSNSTAGGDIMTPRRLT
jgi:hypothetical protein